MSTLPSMKSALSRSSTVQSSPGGGGSPSPPPSLLRPTLLQRRAANELRNARFEASLGLPSLSTKQQSGSSSSVPFRPAAPSCAEVPRQTLPYPPPMPSYSKSEVDKMYPHRTSQTSLLSSLLSAPPSPPILVSGPPSTGKTSVVRALLGDRGVYVDNDVLQGNDLIAAVASGWIERLRRRRQEAPAPEDFEGDDESDADDDKAGKGVGKGGGGEDGDEDDDDEGLEEVRERRVRTRRRRRGRRRRRRERERDKESARQMAKYTPSLAKTLS